MDKMLSLIGLASAARKVVVGETLLKSLKNVKLIFLANDASCKTKERFSKKAYFYKIPIIDTYNSQDLSFALGKFNIKAIGINDEGFKDLIIKEGGFTFGKTNTQEK